MPGRPVIHPTWTLIVAPAWRDVFADVATARAFVARPPTVTQENDRGAVWFVRHGETTLVVKWSRSQVRRRWIRLTSFYRRGEGFRTFDTLSRLHRLGLAVPEPVLALERVRCGFVVGSWHVYRYVEGRVCGCADVVRIASALERLHAHGWVHRDPHVKNFLWDGERTWIIDCLRARPWRARYARQYDVVLLNKCCAGARIHYPGFTDRDPVYRLAQCHNDWVVYWRRIKRAVRALLRIPSGPAGSWRADGHEDEHR